MSYQEIENEPVGILTLRDAFAESLEMWRQGKPRSELLDNMQELGLTPSAARVVAGMVMHTVRTQELSRGVVKRS